MHYFKLFWNGINLQYVKLRSGPVVKLTPVVGVNSIMDIKTADVENQELEWRLVLEVK